MHSTKSLEEIVYVLASVGDTVLGTLTIIHFVGSSRKSKKSGRRFYICVCHLKVLRGDLRMLYTLQSLNLRQKRVKANRTQVTFLPF